MGFNGNLVGWLASFFTDRQVSFCMGTTSINPSSIGNVGIPQGSPLSPPLAALYTSPCWNNWSCTGDHKLQCYVDDSLLKVTHSNPKVAALKAGLLLTQMEKQLNACRLQIDHRDKLELICFASKQSQD
jgi:hypothetical protein